MKTTLFKYALQGSLKSDSHLPKKNCFNCFTESPLKMTKNAFYFILKGLFVLKIFKCLSRLFGHVRKTAWLEIYDWFQNLWRHSLVNKQLRYTYPISYEVKASRQWNLVSLQKIAREIFFFKNHTENEAGKLVTDLLLFSKKALYEVKASCLFDSPQPGI